MSFTDAIRSCFSKYVTFSGRAARPEYWWFVLFIVIVSVVLGIIDNVTFGPRAEGDMSNGLLTSLFNLAILLPIMAAGWRRMHDTGKPGWYLLLPMLVSIATFAFMMMGIITFAGMEKAGVDSDALRGSAVILGMTGMFAIMLVQFVLAVVLLWWLTRPSDPAENAYGPAPTS